MIGVAVNNGNELGNIHNFDVAQLQSASVYPFQERALTPRIEKEASLNYRWPYGCQSESLRPKQRRKLLLGACMERISYIE
jgi:hypothetical protein